MAVVRACRRRAATHRDVQGDQAPALGGGHRVRRSGVADREVGLARVGYREFPPPTMLRDLVESVWVADGPPEPGPVLPDGCMDP